MNHEALLSYRTILGYTETKMLTSGDLTWSHLMKQHSLLLTGDSDKPVVCCVSLMHQLLTQGFVSDHLLFFEWHTLAAKNVH